MRAIFAITAGLVWHWCSFAQTFDAASVKASRQILGRDANRQVSFGAAGVSGRNVTLKRLIAEAYNLQLYQISGGPKWLNDSEYDIDAKAGAPAAKENLRSMLRALLAERFLLAVHTENKELPVYDLVVHKESPNLHPSTGAAGAGSRTFHGTMRQFADLLSIQLAIPEINDPGRPAISSGAPVPVLDKTGLDGVYDIPMDIRPEPGGSMFSLWQRALDPLGLKLESRKSKVDILIVDRAERIPTAN